MNNTCGQGNSHLYMLVDINSGCGKYTYRCKRCGGIIIKSDYCPWDSTNDEVKSNRNMVAMIVIMGIGVMLLMTGSICMAIADMNGIQYRDVGLLGLGLVLFIAGLSMATLPLGLAMTDVRRI